MASISRTICPLARPPTAGLHDICPIVSRFCVNIKVRQPMRAAARAASIPACPLPTTTTSYSVGSLNIAKALQISHVRLLALAADGRCNDFHRQLNQPPTSATGSALHGRFVRIGIYWPLQLDPSRHGRTLAPVLQSLEI